MVLNLDTYKNEPESKTAAWRNLGLAYLQKRQNKEALVAFDSALKIAYKTRHNFFIININNKKAEIFLQQNQIEKAIEILQQSIHFSEVYHFPNERQIAYKLLGRIYELNKEYSKAHHFQSLYINLYDSIHNIENKKQTADLQAQYESFNKDAQISVLSKSQKQQNQQIKEQKLIIYLSIGLCVLLAFSMFIFYRSSLKEKQARELALQQCNAIAEQNEEIRQNKEELKAQAEYLKQSNELKDKILAIIGHDLRSPINSLKGILELFEQDDIGAAELGIIAKGVKKNIDTLSLTMDNLLSWAYSQMGGLVTKPEKIKIDTLVKEVLALFESNRIGKQISIENRVYENQFVFADVNQLRLILRNIISNAIKFTPIEGQIAIEAKEEKDFLLISIKDSGIGMSKEKLDRLFTSAKDASVQGTAGEKGTGLGLRLSKEFIDKNEGQIWVESEERKGTTFSFSLPIRN